MTHKVPEKFAYHLPNIGRSRYPSREEFEFIFSLGFFKIIALGSFPSVEEINTLRARHWTLNHFPLSARYPELSPEEKQIFERQLSIILDHIYGIDDESKIFLYDDDGYTGVGTVCALMRRIEGWPEDSVLQEFYRFFPDESWTDQHVNLILNFDISRWRR